MKVNLSPYSNKKICVAVSGGRDSMALLHYLTVHGGDFNISVSALNCEHGMRGEASERDSAFVAAYCGSNGIELHSFKAEKGAFKNENDARLWRWQCYESVLSAGKADLIATAHHLNDSAETVIFNLARGTALSGMCGISDEPERRLIRPMIGCSRLDIDAYTEENNVPYVTDESNLTDDYTRNKIRHNVLPALEEAVDGAARNIYRFSQLAAEDEEYFDRQSDKITVNRFCFGYLIKPCSEKVIFRRAAQKIIARFYRRKDYTAEILNRLFELQSAENGKKFGFLGLFAVKENGGVAIVEEREHDNVSAAIPFYENINSNRFISFAGRIVCAVYGEREPEALDYLKAEKAILKSLKFDIDKIPESAVIRFRREGDKFTKFGGGSKSLSDYFTDKKIPQSMRGTLPLVCDGSEVLIVGGVEISDKIKLCAGSVNQGVFICVDPLKIN